MIPLTRNLIVFDLETTGADPKTARICEIGFLLVKPDGTEQSFQSFINPLIPIPPEATAIHGITDEMVKDKPTWSTLAERMATGFTDVDLAGYNVKYDIAVFEAECRRVDLEWTHTGAVIDAFRFWQVLEPRTLSDAVRYWLPNIVEHEGAHRADADVRMTYEVLKEQCRTLRKWRPDGVDHLDSVQALHDLLWPRPKDAVDAAGKIVWIAGAACLGPWSKKHGGKPLSVIPRDYLQWIVDNDFPFSTKQIIRDALAGKFPVKGD